MTGNAPTATSIDEGKKIIVQGLVSFSHIASRYDGEALAKRVADARRNGINYPTEVPHSLLTVHHATVQAQNPNAPTKEEEYVLSKLFTSNKHPEREYQFSGENRTKNLPPVLVSDGNGSYRQVTELLGEIAKDTPVRLVISTYKSGNYANKGLGLDAVILETTEVPYANAAGSIDLSAYGITVAGPIAPVSAEDAAPAAPAAPQAGFVGSDASGLPAAPTGPVGPAFSAPAAPAAPQAQAAPAQASFSAPAAPAEPVAPAAPSADPFSAPTPSWGGAGITAPE